MSDTLPLKDIIARKGAYGKAIGDANQARVRAFMVAHIGATNRECASELSLSEMKVSKHMKKIRAEWKP